MSGLDFSDRVGLAFSGVLICAYLAGGVYLLRLRYRYHHDFSAASEAITLGLVALFLVTETFILRIQVSDSPIIHMFSLLGLVLSAAALYGPTFVSVISRVLVDLLYPPEPAKTHEPRFEPANALERDGDFEGALREFIIIARTFPRDPAAILRCADLCIKLEQPGQAAAWYERAIPLLDDPEKCLGVTNRLCEIYQRTLTRPQDAARVLDTYIARFAQSEYAESIKARRARIGQITAS